MCAGIGYEMRFAALWLGLMVVPAVGQNAEQELFSIRGTVVDAKTGAPIGRAVVVIPGRAVNSPGQPVFTGEDGTFELGGLRPGRYQVMAHRPGYDSAWGGETGAASSAWVTVGPSQRDVVLKLDPLAVVEGVVRDEHGEPAPGIRVQLLWADVTLGTKHYQPRAEMQTDDQGRYRLFDVQPGRYVLWTPLASSFMAHVGTVPPSRGPREWYAPVFAPDSQDEPPPEDLAIGHGETVAQDLRVRAGPVYQVRGRLVGFPMQPQPVLQLFQNGLPVGGQIALNMNSGHFVVQNLPAGEYELVVSESAQRVLGRHRFMVSGNTEGVTIHAQTATRVFVPTGNEDSAGFNFELRRVDEPYPQLELDGREEQEGGYRFAVLPGRYRVAVTTIRDGREAYVAAVRVAGQDILARELVVGEGGGEVVVEVEIQKGAAQLAVKPDEPVGGVVLYRETPDGPVFHEHFCGVVPECIVTGLMPGAYRVLTWRKGEQVEYRNPRELERWQPAAVVVTLKEGEKGEVRVKPVGREPR